MSVTKLNATLPKPETDRNGLDEIAGQLYEHPHRQQVIIAIVDAGKTVLEHATDEDISPGVTVHARIRRVEALTGRDAEIARLLLMRAADRRAGVVVLPLDTELEMIPREDGD